MSVLPLARPGTVLLAFNGISLPAFHLSLECFSSGARAAAEKFAKLWMKFPVIEETDTTSQVRMLEMTSILMRAVDMISQASLKVVGHILNMEY